MTPTSACRNIFSGPLLTGLQSCVSCVVYPTSRPVVRLPDFGRCTCSVAAGLRERYSSWFSEFRPAYSIVFRPFSTPQLGRLLVFVARTTSVMFSPVFTVYEHPSVSSLNWRSSSTEPSTSVFLGICLISSATPLIYRREVDFGRQLPDFSTSALHDLSLSVTAHSLLRTTVLEQPT